jgi:DNA-binding transcriptional MerR regulator
MDASWTLSELVEEASAALERVPAPDNGQIRAVPDERSLRYYTTLGLLDRPAAMRGRTALYGKRHLAQVVAIKRLQSNGKALAEIQAIFASLDDATLTRLSGVALPRVAAPRAAARADFWRSPPGAPAPATDTAAATATAAAAATVPAAAAATAAATAAVSVSLRLSLAPGVDLLVDATPGAPVDLSAIARAAQPLLAELTRQGLRPETRGDAEQVE